MNPLTSARRRPALLLLAIALVAGTGHSVVATDAAHVVPMEIEPGPYLGASMEDAEWAVLDADAEITGTTSWRVVDGTGNCCENFVEADVDGRIYDWGGTWIRFTDDDGATWQEVSPPTALLLQGGEGAITTAPDGDIVGVTWDPYEGDRLMSFLHDAQTDVWTYAEQPIHLPFYDREWTTAIPGLDLGLGGDYVTAIRGAWPSKDVIHYSGDGLTYTAAGSKRAEAAQNEAIGGPLPVAAYPEADWVQPHAETGIVPLGGGYAFGNREFIGLIAGEPCGQQRYLMTPDGAWHCYTGGENLQWRAADSEGTLHTVVFNPNGTATHHYSTDGGLTSTAVPLLLPAGLEFHPDWDMEANAAAGVVAIAASWIHPENGRQHVVIKLVRDEETGEWVQDRILLVGDAGFNSGSGVTSSGARMDFASLAMLPDGRVAVSFNDAAHTTPALAIELPAEASTGGSGGGGATGTAPLVQVAPPNAELDGDH